MIIDCAAYGDGRRLAAERQALAEARAQAGAGGFVWIDLAAPSEADFAAVAREFGLHELAAEDAVRAHQRPKLEIYGQAIFLVLKSARYVDSQEVIEVGEIQVFCGPGFFISVRHGESSKLEGLRAGLEARPDLLRLGPAAALYWLLDRVVDDYRPVINGVEKDIDDLEDQVFDPGRVDAAVAERIYYLKREVLEFHRAAQPLVGPLGALSGGQLAQVPAPLPTFFRDVQDHALRVAERVDAFRDLLTSMLQAQLTQVSVRQNEDMRRISAWVAIIALPTMIAGVYGMNFEHMPELRWAWGYPVIVGAMALGCITLWGIFRRARWL